MYPDIHYLSYAMLAKIQESMRYHQTLLDEADSMYDQTRMDADLQLDTGAWRSNMGFNNIIQLT